jgi:hypothetical protein
MSVVASSVVVNSSGNNGSIVLTVSGGNGTFAYSWKKNGSAFATTRDLTGLAPADYVCTITSGGQTATVSATITGIMVLTATPNSVRVSFQPVAGTKDYRIQYTVSPSTDIKVYSKSGTATAVIVTGLTPTKTYNFAVYSTVADVTTLKYSGTVALPVDTSAAGFSKSALLSAAVSPVSQFDIRSVQSSATVTKEAAISSVFSSGDKLAVKATVGTVVKTLDTSFLPLNGTAAVKKADKIYVPFDAKGSSTQTITLTLRSGATQTVFYNSATGKVTINGVTYNAGQSLMLDGQVLKLLSA